MSPARHFKLSFVCLLFSLFFIFSPGSILGKSVRTIDLKIAVDDEFRSQRQWMLEIKRLIASSSQEFEKQFGIRFRIKKIEPWFSDGSLSSMYELFSELRKKIGKGDCDAVIGFTSQHLVRYDFFGIASYLHGYIIVRKIKATDFMRSTLIHELCHLFGAIDIEQEGSIMDVESPGKEFDSFTSDVIRLNRLRSFNPSVFPLLKEKLDESIFLLRERKRLRRQESNVNVFLALFYVEKGDYEAAIEECTQALGMDSDLPEIYNLLGIAYRKSGRIDQAIKEYQKVLRVRPEIAEVHYNLGIAYMKKDLIEEAIGEYKKAIELNPNYAKAYANLGFSYLEKEMVDQAILECQKALEIYPRLAEALSTLGAAHLLREEFEEAEAVSRKAVQINPELPGVHNNLGSIYMQKKMFDEAIQEYLEALDLKPEYWEAQYNLGRVYLIQGIPDQAIKKFNQAIRIKPDYHQAYSNLASAYLIKGMTEEAIEKSQMAIEIKPDYAHAYSLLGYAYLKKEMIKEARDACEKAMRLNPDLPEPHNLLGILLERAEKREALDEYSRAIELKPDYFEPHFNLGNYYFKRNLLPESEKYYKKAIEFNPKFAKAFNNLAVVYFYLKKYDLALKYLRKAENLGMKVSQEFKKEVVESQKESIGLVHGHGRAADSNLFDQPPVVHFLQVEDLVLSHLAREPSSALMLDFAHVHHADGFFVFADVFDFLYCPVGNRDLHLLHLLGASDGLCGEATCGHILHRLDIALSHGRVESPWNTIRRASFTAASAGHENEAEDDEHCRSQKDFLGHKNLLHVLSIIKNDMFLSLIE